MMYCVTNKKFHRCKGKPFLSWVKEFFAFQLFFIVSLIIFFTSCDSSASQSADQDEVPDSDTVVSLPQEAGFIEIEPVSYLLGADPEMKNPYTTEQARIWYIFQPSTESPGTKPLFVFFNGGPGSSTLILLGGNTSKFTVDPNYTDGKEIAANPYDWAAYGNLLYIDARQTGFSYDMMNDPSDRNNRWGGFSEQNFNIFIDAADFTRVILRFLASHPDIRKNPVVLVGESYGGVRSTCILHLLTRYPLYANEETALYYDESLTKEIENHFSAIFPEISDRPFPPELIASQFGRQILIQPLFAGDIQTATSDKMLEEPGSPVYKVAEETGTTYIPCSQRPEEDCHPFKNIVEFMTEAGRCMHDIAQPPNCLSTHAKLLEKSYLKLANFAMMTGMDPATLTLMYPEQRKNAYRSLDTRDAQNVFSTSTSLTEKRFSMIYQQTREAENQPEPENLEKEFFDFFGPLSLWDDYYLDLNALVNWGFSINHPVTGKMFLENLRLIKTFITNAENDIVIYGPAIPACLTEYSEVESVKVESASFEVVFSDGETKTVTFPFYPESSHSVSLSQPGKLFTDVGAWLEN